MKCLLETLCCSLGPRPCFIFCCRYLKESTTTRLFYSAILTIAVILSILSHDGSFLSWLYAKYTMEMGNICQRINAGSDCSRIIGFISIYRLCIPLCLFHVIMAVLTICVNSSRSVRGKLHNGFWVWKILILSMLYIAAYMVPVVENQVKVWMIMGIIGGIVFIYIQQMTLIDLAYEVNGIWHNKSKQSRAFIVCLYFCTFCLYLLTIGLYTIMLIWYGLPQRCTLNLAVIGINFFLTMLFSFCSIFSNTLREKRLWLPGAVISAFVAFLTLTALNSQPRILSSDVPWLSQQQSPSQQTSAHPIVVLADQLNRLMSEPFANSNVPMSAEGVSTTQSNVRINRCLPNSADGLANQIGNDLFTVIGIVLVLLWSLYVSFRTTLQARRLGIYTRRQKLKRLLMTIHELPEPSIEILRDASRSEELKEIDATGQLSLKQVEQQERALDLLTAAVVELPDPAVFRRPSARQPGEADRSDGRPQSPPLTSIMKDSYKYGSPETESQSKSSLRIASSVPDLTATMKRLERQKRADIQNVVWDESRNEPSDGRPLDASSQPQSGLRSAQLSNATERVPATEMHSQSKKLAKKRADTKRVSSRPARISVLGPVLDNEAGLPPSPTSRVVIPDGSPNILPPTKRSSMVDGSGFPPCLTLVDSISVDGVPVSSPSHPRYKLARSASELALDRQITRLLETRPDLAKSFAFLKPMLNTSVPREGHIIYNELIAPVYSYSWFHFIYACATLYIMTQLTNWYNPQISNVSTLSGSWANMWMRLGSCLLALLLYAVTIVCPQFCARRRSGETPLVPMAPTAATAENP